MKRIFIVGFPRSGTTFLQSVLMCDERVFSFPETQVFNLGPQRRGIYRFFPIGLRVGIYCTIWMKKNFGCYKLFLSLNKSKNIKNFFFEIEKLALFNNKSILLEKTPGHARHLKEIRELYPDATIIHLVRNNVNAVSSMSLAAKGWGGDQDKSSNFKRWLDYLAIAYLDKDQSNTYIIKYEDLLSNLEKKVSLLNSQLDLKIDTVDVDNKIKENSKLIVNESESWKVNNLTVGVKKIDQSSKEVDFLPDFCNFLIDMNKL